MLKLYKNKFQTFECSIEIEGADTSEATARLVLYPHNDTRNVMYSGKVVDNKCVIDINSNVNVAKHGTVVLEVIVDSSLIFNPWEDSYEIVDQVKIREASINYNSKDRVMPKVKVSGLDGGSVTVRDDNILKTANYENVDKAALIFAKKYGKAPEYNYTKEGEDSPVKVKIPISNEDIKEEVKKEAEQKEEVKKEAEQKEEVKKEAEQKEEVKKEAEQKEIENNFKEKHKSFNIDSLNIFDEFAD